MAINSEIVETTESKQKLLTKLAKSNPDVQKAETEYKSYSLINSLINNICEIDHENAPEQSSRKIFETQKDDGTKMTTGERVDYVIDYLIGNLDELSKVDDFATSDLAAELGLEDSPKPTPEVFELAKELLSQERKDIKEASIAFQAYSDPGFSADKKEPNKFDKSGFTPLENTRGFIVNNLKKKYSTESCALKKLQMDYLCCQKSPEYRHAYFMSKGGGISEETAIYVERFSKKLEDDAGKIEENKPSIDSIIGNINKCLNKSTNMDNNECISVFENCCNALANLKDSGKCTPEQLAQITQSTSKIKCGLIKAQQPKQQQYLSDTSKEKLENCYGAYEYLSDEKNYNINNDLEILRAQIDYANSKGDKESLAELKSKQAQQQKAMRNLN